jgi:hypothetical protein
VLEESYVVTERTYERLAVAGVSPMSALHVLSHPVVRRHIGAVLTVAGQDRDGAWLTVALMEEEDDQYTVTGARYLGEDEIVNIRQMRGEEL